MRRLTAVALMCAVALLCAVQSSAQKYGVVGGATFSSIHGLENSSKTGWNVGGTVQFKLPLGFSVQPSLVYNCKAAELSSGVGSAGLKVDYLELPVSFQWGPDLLIFRPFIDVSPYIGYALASKATIETIVSAPLKWDSSSIQRFECGLGLGGGIEVWRLQVTCRYNWNFGALVNADTGFQSVREAFGERNFGGVTLSLAFLFGK